ncbi:MAG: trigger factor [Desulfovibrio sp. MES5]|uniref:trigger factor n=1 Tax=Desulfovibrio sp. MES5 TaxID=1899016 RepID=UPI000B9D43F9|nr:trigger factor [Desulfovibrio sp. MES5]OXS27720.1 MAG: trigger factor [Desulfovibrio sp. MES5]
MEYSAEDISPVRKKVVITTEPQEVEAAIMGAVALYKTSVQVDGFRKGKVPASVIEQRFRDKIYEEARQDLINVHINDVMQKLDVSPLSGLDVDTPDTFERGKGFSYTIEFEVLPAFDLPPYEGMDVEQEKVVLDEKEVQDVLDRILRDRATLVPVDGSGPAVDGQVATVDFAAFDNGEPIEGVKAESFDLALGERQALEDFEALVKTVKYGEEGEGEIRFPDDFLAKDLAGKTVTMKVKVHAIKERKLPELNDELAKTLGLESVDKLKETIANSYIQSRTNLNKSMAQKNLLDGLLKMVQFELPPSLVETQMNTLLGDMAARLERQGRSLESLGKSMEELRKETQPQADELARSQVLLLSIAKKEGLDVTDHEVTTQIYQLAMRTGEDFKTLREQYERSGMIFVLRDRMLADKAMDLVYAKANVKEVEPKAPEAGAAGDAAPGASASAQPGEKEDK